MSHYDDDLGGLSDYLSAYSGLGSVPTSLQGYGFGGGRHLQELSALGGTGFAAATGAGWDVEAIGRKPPAALLKTKFNCQNRCTERFNEWTPYAIQDISRDLIAVQAMKGPVSKSWSKVAAGWKVYATTFKVYPEAEPASGGTYSSEFVWLNKLARAKLAADAAKVGPIAQPSTPTPVTKAPPKPAGKEYVSTTAAVQDILVRLGWRGKLTTQGPVQKALTDGQYGGTTAANWAQSANKRKLDPAIKKVAADGSTVAVNESTFYALKALADQLVPPTATKPMPTGTSMFTWSPSSIAVVTPDRLGEVLGRLVGAKSSGQVDLKEVYQRLTKERGLASDIEAGSGSWSGKVAVVKASWDALVREYDSKAPAPPPVAPSEKQNVDAAMGQIAKKATASTNASTLKNAFNVAVAAKTIQREPFKGDTWTTDYVDLLLKIIKPADAIWEKAWRQMLTKGKLVSSDLKKVKLTPEVSSALKKIEVDFLAAKKAETQTFQGYTKVNTAKLIESVNALNVSDKTFDPSKGAQELADALKTFLDNTKQGVVGDIVKVQDRTKDVFVKDDVLVKLAAATKAAEDRARATDSYRKSMVSEALKASSDTVTVDQIQQTFAAALMAGKVSGEEKKLYEAVKLNGAFDAPTKAAYTFLAKRVTLEAEIQQFEKLVRAQLGPRFKAAMVQEVYNKTWNEFLSQAVGKKDGKVVVRTLPALGQKIRSDSDAYRKVKGDQRIAREKEAEFKKTMAEAVKKSNVIISLFDVQMALLESEARKEIKASGVKTTGRGDEPTKVALFNLVASSIFGTKHKERWDWDKYLDEVGIRVESPSSVKKGWVGATYVGLPQAAANLLSDRAAAWMEKHGFPAGYTDLAPLPLSNQELRLRFDKPTVITVKRPAQKGKEVRFEEKAEKKVAEDKRSKANKKKQAAEAKARAAADKKKKAAETKKKADEARAKAEAAKQKAAQDASDAAAKAAAAKAEADARAAELDAKVAQNAATQAASDATTSRIESAVAEREAVQAEVATGSTSAGGAAQGGQATVGPITIAPQITIPGGGSAEPALPSPLPSPEPAPAPVPEPAPVTEAGVGGGMGLAFLGGLGVLALLFGEKKDSKTKRPADARYKKRYATRGGRYGSR